MSLTMMRSAQTVRPCAASRRALTVVNAGTIGGKTTSGKKTVSGKSETQTLSQRQAEVAAYLETLPGASGPFKGVWDPLNLSLTASVRDVRRWRESEITHGRVAMLAALGFIVGEQLEDYPLFFNWDGQITGPAFSQFSQVQQGFWEPLLICIGLAESYRVSLGWETPTGTGFNNLKDDYEMGNLYFDPLGLKPEDPEELFELQTKELNNGRLAMIAISGFVLQEIAEPGVEIFQHLFFTIEKDAIEELDVIEKDLGLPQTFPIPTLPAK